MAEACWAAWARMRKPCSAWLAGSLMLLAPCGAHARLIQGLQVENRHFRLSESVLVHLSLDQPTQGCGAVFSDDQGRTRRLLVRGDGAQTAFDFARDGRYEIKVRGKPIFDGYDLYWACEGHAAVKVTVESQANRAKRLAAAAAAKKAAEERAAADAARQAAEAAARAEEERTAGQREIERQKAALEAAARQRALDLQRRTAEAKAELEAARAEAKRLADLSAIDRIKGLFASKAPPGESAKGASASPPAQQ